MVALVIAQADPITQAGLATVILVPLTTQDRPGARALRVPIRARDRLLCDSFAMVDQPRSLDCSRLGDGPLTTLRPEELAELERALLGALGIGLSPLSYSRTAAPAPAGAGHHRLGEVVAQQ